jgi:hypothetical protein
MIGQACCKREKVLPAPAILLQRCGAGLTGIQELGGVDRSCKSSAVAPQTWPWSRGPTRAGVHCRLNAGTFLFFKWGDGVKMRDG